MARFRIQYARERLKAARLLLGQRFFRDSSARSCLSGLYSVWALLELNNVDCFHSSEVLERFCREPRGKDPEQTRISAPLRDLIEADLEERGGDFFQMDAEGAAYQYQNAEKILNEIERIFKARGIKL